MSKFTLLQCWIGDHSDCDFMIYVTKIANYILDGFQTKDMKYQWADESVSSGSLTPPGFTIENIVGTDTSLTTSTGSYRISYSIKNLK